MELNANPTEASLATLNLPAYNPNNIKSWCRQMQAIFNAKNIAPQRARYCYIVEKLLEEAVEEVTDLLKTKYEENVYDT